VEEGPESAFHWEEWADQKIVRVRVPDVLRWDQKSASQGHARMSFPNASLPLQHTLKLLVVDRLVSARPFLIGVDRCRFNGIPPPWALAELNIPANSRRRVL
jgi:hypothetical protein